MKPRKPTKRSASKPTEPPHRFGFFKLPRRHHIKGLTSYDPQDYSLDGSDGSDNKRRTR